MPAAVSGQTAPAAGASRVIRRGAEIGAWDGLAALPYKAADGTWAGVTRRLLAGGAGSACAFELRYFELAPGGRTARERHHHEHAVVVLRGAGEVTLGDVAHRLGAGDLVRVAPGEAHQFRNAGAEPFGFLCVVDATRDRPEPLPDADDAPVGAPSCDVPP
ncbi:MAG TPA: cupin domain-containing protein [Thermoanaerobaculia bacterium]|jgi:quercetin dioxygenase-like cupin family protein|nr:cupin domain-containing protein [Thermoanaerobaculia bacterium]